MKKWEMARSLLLVIAGALIFVSFRYPMWSIYLWANMYPNGIGMSVYAYKPADPPDVEEMDGGMHELNVLNHYIGMKPISRKLPVFTILPTLLGLSAVLLILSAFIRREKFFKVALWVFLGTAVYGMVTFFYRIYEYGHDLRPDAAIKVPPFTPGIIGWNRIAQFETWSEFGWGTYLVLIAFVLAWGTYFLDRRFRKKALASERA